MTSDLPADAASDYPDPGLDPGHDDSADREAALDAMPQGNAETGDQVDREAFDIEQDADEAVEED